MGSGIFPPSTAGAWEREILKGYDEGKPSKETLGKKYKKKGVAVIIRLRVGDSSENNKKKKDTESDVKEKSHGRINMDRICAFSVAMQLIQKEAERVDGVKLIKRDEERAFLFCRKASQALSIGFYAAAACAQIRNGGLRYRMLNLSVGIASGSGLAFVFEGTKGDYYGDCVNVASKLGEDYAMLGDILVDSNAFDSLGQTYVDLLGIAGIRRNKIVVTTNDKVSIDTYRMMFEKADSLVRFLGDYAPPDVHDFASEMAYVVSSPRRSTRENDFDKLMLRRILESSLPDEAKAAARVANTDKMFKEKATVEGVMFNSDMSGFTRLTKKHGILYFLEMILKMRSIVVPIITKANGKILTYEGDNVVAFFNDATSGCDAAHRVHEALRVYNRKLKDADRKILIKIGLTQGHVLYTSRQLFGEAWMLCEELGENHGKKRQVIMSKHLRDQVDLSEHARIIERESAGSLDGHQFCTVHIRHEDEAVAEGDGCDGQLRES